MEFEDSVNKMRRVGLMFLSPGPLPQALHLFYVYVDVCASQSSQSLPAASRGDPLNPYRLVVMEPISGVIYVMPYRYAPATGSYRRLVRAALPAKYGR